MVYEAGKVIIIKNLVKKMVLAPTAKPYLKAIATFPQYIIIQGELLGKQQTMIYNWLDAYRLWEYLAKDNNCNSR